MDLEFIDIRDAKDISLDRSRKVVAAFNAACETIDKAIVAQEIKCRAVDTSLANNSIPGTLRDLHFTDWLAKHRKWCLGRLDHLLTLRFRAEQHFDGLVKLADMPVICTVRCGDTQDVDGVIKTVVAMAPEHVKLEEGLCIDVIVGDTDAVYRITYMSGSWTNTPIYIEKDDYLVDGGEWTKQFTLQI